MTLKQVIHMIKLTAKTVDEDPASCKQPKYKEPRTRSPKTTAKLI